MKQYSIAAGLIIASLSLQGQRTATVTLIPYPLTAQDVTTLLEDVKRGERMTRYEMENLLKPAPVNGIFASYSGFLQVSDNQGIIEFVRKHANPEFTLIITTDIKPIRTFGMTVHHWELEPTAKAAFFKVQKEIDPTSGYCFWNAEKSEKPANDIVPLDALIIFARPESVFISEGATPCADAGENLILPPIYIRKEIRRARNAFEVVTFSHFFRPEQEAVKKEKALLETVINEQEYVK